MNGRGWHTERAQDYHTQHFSTSSSQYAEPFVYNYSDQTPSVPYVPYYNPVPAALVLVPGMQATQSSLNITPEQYGYHLLPASLPVSYGTGFYPISDDDDDTQDYEHENMLTQFDHLSLAPGQDPPQYLYAGSSSGIFPDPPTQHTPDEDEIHGQRGQHWTGTHRSGRQPSTHVHSSTNSQIERLNDVVDPVKRFSILWHQRVPKPERFAPPQLANQLVRIFAYLGEELDTDLRDTTIRRFVEPILSSHPDSMSVFWKRLHPLWKSYKSLRVQRHALHGEEDESKARLTRRIDVEKAIRALECLDSSSQRLQAPLSKKYIAARAFHDMLDSKGVDFAMLATKELTREVKDFAIKADLGSDNNLRTFKTKQELMYHLNRWFREVKPTVKPSKLTNYEQFGSYLDGNRAPEER